VAEWLALPVPHIRDVRTALLIKLALLDRRGGDPRDLLDAQRLVVRPIALSLERQRSTVSDFNRVLVSWRAESANAALRFLDDLLDGNPPS